MIAAGGAYTPRGYTVDNDNPQPPQETEPETTETPAPETPQDDVNGETPDATPDEAADTDKIANLSARMDAIESAIRELRDMMSAPSDAIEDMAEDTEDYGEGEDYNPDTITVEDLFKTTED